MVIQVVEPPTVSPAGHRERTLTQASIAGIATHRRQLEHRALKSATPRIRAMPSATPRAIAIGTLPDPRLRLKHPIQADVVREGGHVGVWSPVFEELGTGPHLSAAIRDFQQSLVELYFELQEDEQRLGPDLAQLWQKMQAAITYRP